MTGKTEIPPEGHGLLHEVASHLHRHQTTGINNRRRHVDQILPLRCSDGAAKCQGRNCESSPMQEILERQAFRKSRTASLQQQSDGMVERYVKNLLHAVRN